MTTPEREFMELYRQRAMMGGEDYQQIGQRNRQIAMDKAMMLGGCRDCMDDEEGGVANVWTNFVHKKKGFPKKGKAARAKIQKEYYEGPGDGSYIRSPVSGRSILVGGPTYKKLVAEGAIHPRSKSAIAAHDKRQKSVLGKAKKAKAAPAAPKAAAKGKAKKQSVGQKKWIAEVQTVQNKKGVSFKEALVMASAARKGKGKGSKAAAAAGYY